MQKRERTHDPYVDIIINDYRLVEKVGKGRIGSVYQAVRSNPPDTFACKVIPENKLKDGWQREIEKVVRLRGVPNIVQYHAHGIKLGVTDAIPKCNNKKAIITMR